MKPVSMGGISKEDLPFSVVYYPNLYGTFFAFAEDVNSPVMLCACSKPAIKNLLRLKALLPTSENSNPLRMTSLDNWYFPNVIAELSLSATENPFNPLQFAGGLCHRCNSIIPKRRYCHEMYGSKFIQQYGWYYNQAYLRLGILPVIEGEPVVFLPDVCPPEFQDAINAWARTDKEYQNSNSDNPEVWNQLLGIARKQHRAFTRLVENTVRQEFGFKNVGESWVAETQLYYEIREALAPLDVQPHASPDWLGSQHLDIFIPELRVAVEYQGRQHFEPVEFFGGKRAFEQTVARDKRKQNLCRENGIKLVFVTQGYNLGDVLEQIQPEANS